MAHLSQQVAGEVVVMNRRSKIVAGIALPLLLILFLWLSWDFRSPDRISNGDISGELKASKAVTSDGISARKPSDSKEDLPLINPFEMIEEFDTRFLQLAEAEGDLWVSGLKGLAGDSRG